MIGRAGPNQKGKTRMTMSIRNLRTLLAVMVVTASLSGCGYNDIQRGDESTKAAWSEVLNQYQRRADLIPNLVNTVKGYAQQEQQVLTQVTEARSRATSIQATPELVNNPEAFKQWQEAQRALSSGAISRAKLTVSAAIASHAITIMHNRRLVATRIMKRRCFLPHSTQRCSQRSCRDQAFRRGDSQR